MGNLVLGPPDQFLLSYENHVTKGYLAAYGKRMDQFVVPHLTISYPAASCERRQMQTSVAKINTE